MSLRSLAGQAPFSKYQRSTAELISEMFWVLALVFAVPAETVMRGITTTAIMPRIVTTASNSSSEKPNGRSLRSLDLRNFMSINPLGVLVADRSAPPSDESSVHLANVDSEGNIAQRIQGGGEIRVRN